METEGLVPVLGAHPLALRPLTYIPPTGSVELILMASETKLCLLTALVYLLIYGLYMV